jgi:hypothetical protein
MHESNGAGGHRRSLTRTAHPGAIAIYSPDPFLDHAVIEEWDQALLYLGRQNLAPKRIP